MDKKPEYTADDLTELGFVLVGEWKPNGDGIALGKDGAGATSLLATRDALYAFISGSRVHYIGKTSRKLGERLNGYANPGPKQQTNLRCNSKIRELVAGGTAVQVLGFTATIPLRYAVFDLSIPAGLEGSLIRAFQPPWNIASKGGKALPETYVTEIEAEGAGDLTTPRPTIRQVGELPEFTIDLGGRAYFEWGFINPGVEASTHLGKHGDAITVYLGSQDDPVVSEITRTANTNGSVRIKARAAIAQWFQKHFKRGQLVTARILGPNEVLLVLPRSG